MTASLRLPLRVVNGSNASANWQARHRRAKQEYDLVALMWKSTQARAVRAASKTRPLLVTIERIGPGIMDGDGNSTSLKHVRDEVARQLGVNDRDGTDGVTWAYRQTRGARGEYAVVVHLTPHSLVESKGT